MTVTGASASASQMLVVLLNRLASSQNASQPVQTQASGSSFAPAGGCAAPNALTGSSSPQLSSAILNVLMQLQQDAGTDTTDTAATNPAQDPAQQLFSAKDSDGDGSVSQTEMESYIENQGGTQAQADQLFQSLDTSGSGGLSESQMAGAAKARHHHHHHGHGMGADTSQQASNLMSALDTDGDGSVSAGELTDFLTQNGGTADEAGAILSAVDSDGSGSISQAEFASALQNLQQNQWSMANAYTSQPAQTNTIASA